MLTVDNLHANVGDKPILKGLTLSLGAGEIHAIMGPNGAGKSTLGYVLSGRPGYEVTEGSVTFTPPSPLPQAEGPGVGLCPLRRRVAFGNPTPNPSRLREGKRYRPSGPRTPRTRRRWPVPRLPISGRNPRRVERAVPARGAQRTAQASR